MRRRTLEPPRSAVRGDVVHVPLPAPHAAIPVPRPHFDPKRGWFRRIERAVSLALSLHVWPRLPLSAWPYGFLLGRLVTVAEAEIPVPRLEEGLDGVTLLFVSDVHAGPFVTADAVAEAFAKLGTLGADVVVHGGDLATTNVREVLPLARAIETLRAPLGAFAVLGNHDHYTRDVTALAAFYARCGVRLLNNDAVVVERGGARLALAGIDDWNIGRPDLASALGTASSAAPGAPIVLISHNPDAFFEAAASRVALTVAGHTHGGQVRIPGRPVLVRMSRYRLDEGRFEHHGAQLVVSRGLGVSGFPFRVCCPPEALLLTLRRSPSTTTGG